MIVSFILALLATPIADAQHPAKVPHIGVLADLSLSSPYAEAFRRGLRELGYVEGQNLITEYRSGEGKEERLAKLAAELVQLKVEAIAAFDPPVGAMIAEGTRLAVQNNGLPVTGAKVRRGHESIRGFDLQGFFPPLTVTPQDHEGGGYMKVYQVKGKEWVPVSGWIRGYRDEVMALVKQANKK